MHHLIINRKNIHPFSKMLEWSGDIGASRATPWTDRQSITVVLVKNTPLVSDVLRNVNSLYGYVNFTITKIKVHLALRCFMIISISGNSCDITLSFIHQITFIKDLVKKLFDSNLL